MFGFDIVVLPVLPSDMMLFDAGECLDLGLYYLPHTFSKLYASVHL